VRRVLAERALLLAGLGGAAVLAAGPVDNAWHVRYGRDAVLWSPPHLLAVAASVALSVGLLTGLRHSTGRPAAVARVLAGAGVLAALLVPVLEYDSDVPQFSPVLYLPVVTAGTLLAFLVLRAAAPGAWPATTSAVAVTALRALTALLLAGLGMTLTLVPPVLVAAVVDDLLARRRVGDTGRGLVLALVTPASWLPALALQRGTATQVPAALVAPAVLGCVTAALAVLVLTGRLRLRVPRPGLAVPALLALALLVTLGTARPALAHDPGQGEPAGSARLTATRTGGTVTLTARLERPCSTHGTAQVVGRRAGRTVRAPAAATPDPTGGCGYAGTLPLSDDGRWFAYLQLDDATGARLESWLQLPSGATRQSGVKDLYAPPRPSPDAGRDALGALLYLVVVGLLVSSVRLAAPPRRASA